MYSYIWRNIPIRQLYFWTSVLLSSDQIFRHVSVIYTVSLLYNLIIKSVNFANVNKNKREEAKMEYDIKYLKIVSKL